MPEIVLKPEQLEDLERRSPDLRQVWTRWRAKLMPEEALREIASAYKEGLEAGGEKEAARRMREKFDEINPPAPDEKGSAKSSPPSPPAKLPW